MFQLATNVSVAILLLRTLTGVLFFFQGYDKIFNIKIDKVVNIFTSPYDSQIRIPVSVLKPIVFLSSWIEFLGGAFLFLGFFKTYTLYLLSADLFFVAFAFSVIKPMWDMQYYFPRLVFILLLLVIPSYWDLFSLDNILNLRF